jgi:hypothetical protein
LGHGQADVVLSDMAPNLSGLDAIDAPQSLYLAELVLDLSQQVLKPAKNKSRATAPLPRAPLREGACAEEFHGCIRRAIA